MIKPTVTFKPVDPAGRAITAALYDGYPTLAAMGGWTTIARSKNVGITEFQGYDPVSQDIPIIFDGLTRETSQEQPIAALFNMMRARVGPRKEPAVVKVSGPVHFTSYRWVINNIQPQAETRRQSDGARIRGIYTVTLLQHIPGTVIVSHRTSPAKKAKATTSSTQTVYTYYTVKSGDTLGSIAAKLLGSAAKWHDIADLNNLRDPNTLVVGQKLKIPRS